MNRPHINEDLFLLTDEAVSVLDARETWVALVQGTCANLYNDLDSITEQYIYLKWDKFLAKLVNRLVLLAPALFEAIKDKMDSAANKNWVIHTCEYITDGHSAMTYRQLLHAGFPLLPELWWITLNDIDLSEDAVMQNMRTLRDNHVPLPSGVDLLSHAAGDGRYVVMETLSPRVFRFLIHEMGVPVTDLAWNAVVKNTYSVYKEISIGLCTSVNMNTHTAILQDMIDTGFVPRETYEYANDFLVVRFLHDRLGAPTPQCQPPQMDPDEYEKVKAFYGTA